MATVILRPTADSSLSHTCSSGSSGYALINEKTADDDAGYIYEEVKSTSTTTTGSTFVLTPEQNIVGKFTINSWTVYTCDKVTGSAETKTCVITLEVGGSSQQLGYHVMSTSYATQSVVRTVSDGVEYTDISALGTISVKVITHGGKSKSKDDDFQLRITQLYVVLDYTPVSDTTATGIYIKQNGAYTQAQAAYKKVNGVWVQQTDMAALKAEIQSGRYKYGG